MATQRTNDYRHDHTQSKNSAVKSVGEYMASKGTPVQQGAGGLVTNGGDSNIRQLAQPHMAHYKAPKRRSKDNPDLVLCEHEGCKAYPMKEGGLCRAHSISRKKELEREAE